MSCCIFTSECICFHSTQTKRSLLQSWSWNYANWTVDANCLQVNQFDSHSLIQLKNDMQTHYQKAFFLGWYLLTNGNQKVKKCLSYWKEKPNYVNDVKEKLKLIVPCMKKNYIFYKDIFQNAYDTGDLGIVTKMLFNHLWNIVLFDISYLEEPKKCRGLLF